MSSSLDNLPKLHKPDFSREHRLGLVVYGGVSLAIYMNGICQEFYNAVRGRGIYKLIKALTDADIVVDIISGTSAGGINGVLLSYALANSQGGKQIKFEEFADVWKDSGDINQLLFKEASYGVNKSSFFDGEDYKNQIKTALKNRKKDLQKTAPKDDWFSEFRELDLFITGTDILGKIHQVFDTTDCVIDVKDHRAIFHLKYRDYDSENNPFNPEDEITCAALAKLCQITSCFPVAFPAVTVKLKFEGDDPDPDKKLVEWGHLSNRIVPQDEPKQDEQEKNAGSDDDLGKGYRLHFVDGGVLDNRPFSYTIKEIYHRAANRPVFRKLFYVDPSPDRFENNAKYKNMLKPDIVQVIQDSLVALPRYESINNDLDLINEHNEKVRRYKFLLADLEALLDTEDRDRENNDYYDQQRNVYLRTRLISLEDKILPLIFLKSEGLVKQSRHQKSRTKKLDKVAKLLAEPFTDPQGSSERLKLLERLEKEICDLDVDYTLRRYFFITEYVYRLLDEEYLCEWIKNKKKQDIDKFIKNKDITNHKAEIKKQEIDEISVDKIDKTILSNLKNLIIELNRHRKLIEVIKDKLDKLFICEEIEKYFFGLLDPNKVPEPEKQFTEKFYRAMLWLHGQLLNVDLPSDLKIKELNELSDEQFTNIVKQFSETLDENFHKLKEPKLKLNQFFREQSQLEQLKELSTQSVLNKLVNVTNSKLLSNCNGEIEYFNYIKEKLLMYFKEFEKLDTVLYPLDYLAGTPEKQIIETFRISPEDAKLGLSSRFEDGERLDKKLAGDSFRAFGGFLKKSWRANDILWGRLDGLNRIVDALVTEEKIKNFLKFLKNEVDNEAKKEADKSNSPSNIEDYLDRLIEEALLSDSDLKPKDKEYLEYKTNELKKKLKNLLSILSIEDKGKSKELLKELLQDIRSSLVSIGHLIILEKELDETMKASIEEQLVAKEQRELSEKSQASKNETKAPSQKLNKTSETSVEEQSVGIQQKQTAKKSNASTSIPFWLSSLFRWAIKSRLYSLMRYACSEIVCFKAPIPVPKFAPIDCSFDSAITALVVKRIAEESLTSMSLKEKEDFFNEDYKIGSETWKHIPKSELQKLILKCIVIFQDIFKTWQHRTEAQMKSNRSNGLKHNRLNFWNGLGLKVLGLSVNIAIGVIKKILVRRF